MSAPSWAPDRETLALAARVSRATGRPVAFSAAGQRWTLEVLPPSPRLRFSPRPRRLPRALGPREPWLPRTRRVLDAHARLLRRRAAFRRAVDAWTAEAFGS